MTRALGPAWIAGLAALAVFSVMAVLLRTQVAPVAADGFMPQSAFRGYDALALDRFARSLGQGTDAARIYRVALLWLDTAFIVLFAIWAAAVFSGLRGAAKWTGLVLLGAYGVSDLAENRLIWTSIAPVLGQGAAGDAGDLAAAGGMAPAAWFTMSKFGFLVAVLLAAVRALAPGWRRAP
jgi:hypothetical protein